MGVANILGDYLTDNPCLIREALFMELGIGNSSFELLFRSNIHIIRLNFSHFEPKSNTV